MAKRARTPALEAVRLAREAERLERQAEREAKAQAKRTRQCPTCGDTFESDHAGQKYCTPECRPVGRSSQLASSTDRGYGSEHQRIRAEWAPYVEAGEVDCHAKVCFKETRRIEPGTPWDLGHTEDRTDWTGPEHRYCNRKEPQLRGTAQAEPADASSSWDI